MNYTVPVGQPGGELGFNVSYYYSDGYFYTPDNSIRLDPYNLLSAEISYAFLDERARVRLYGINLTDELVWGQLTRSPIDTSSAANQPRTIGVGFEYRWD